MPENQSKLRKRIQNEKQFKNWKPRPEGGRIYWLEIEGKFGWKARYVKQVDEAEETVSFRQEIYNEFDELVEIHEKYPVDKGHIKLKEK